MSGATGLLLAVAVVLAGCGSVDPGSGDDAATTSTLPPVPVPEELAPDEGRLLAPGLSTRGVFDATFGKPGWLPEANANVDGGEDIVGDGGD